MAGRAGGKRRGRGQAGQEKGMGQARTTGKEEAELQLQDGHFEPFASHKTLK